MVLFLIAVIVALLGIIVYLNIEFYKEKKRFRAKIEAMQHVIREITNKQLGQQGKLRLSDELNQSLRSSQHTLSQDIFGLNYALFDMLKNNRGEE